MKKLSRFQPVLITKTFFPGIPIAQINRGQCFKWAYLTYRIFANTELWDMGSHAFIRYRNKFYDSARLNGVSNYIDLPATNNGIGCGCERCRKPAKRAYVPAFKHTWRGCQAKFGVDWDELDRQALKLIQSI